ncbi:MAG TPA: hypothetical protein DCZ95_16550 [Verrucomicrobia bacterium]|nr:MAG: hypothetical protein A2X46_13035 [Lentisphaerae bacterium GWF2_57_35]HBA85693.1 hypothetical protein [Verrucomicrobiota bacterium]
MIFRNEDQRIFKWRLAGKLPWEAFPVAHGIMIWGVMFHGRQWAEKRQNRRLLSGSLIDVVVLRNAWSGLFGLHRIQAKVCDKSMVGLQVQTTIPLAVDTALKIWINPYNGSHKRHLVLRGDVVWCKPSKDESDSYRVGIRLRDYPVRAMQSWVSCMSDELRLLT